MSSGVIGILLVGMGDFKIYSFKFRSSLWFMCWRKYQHSNPRSTVGILVRSELPEEALENCVQLNKRIFFHVDKNTSWKPIIAGEFFSLLTPWYWMSKMEGSLSQKVKLHWGGEQKKEVLHEWFPLLCCWWQLPAMLSGEHVQCSHPEKIYIAS